MHNNPPKLYTHDTVIYIIGFKMNYDEQYNRMVSLPIGEFYKERLLHIRRYTNDLLYLCKIPLEQHSQEQKDRLEDLTNQIELHDIVYTRIMDERQPKVVEQFIIPDIIITPIQGNRIRPWMNDDECGKWIHDDLVSRIEPNEILSSCLYLFRVGDEDRNMYKFGITKYFNKRKNELKRIFGQITYFYTKRFNNKKEAFCVEQTLKRYIKYKKDNIHYMSTETFIPNNVSIDEYIHWIDINAQDIIDACINCSTTERCEISKRFFD